MRFGLLTPVVTRLPGHGAWEAAAEPVDLVKIARHADALGFSHLTCSEHTAVPPSATPGRGSTYWDPLATLSYVAAVTERIGLATNVLVLGYHHPLALAKSCGTLDRLSGGRVVLGVGVGSLRAEFDLLGSAFDDRGARADDAIRALRASWGRTQPSYHGSHYCFDDLVVEPTAPRASVPIWVGGRTVRSLRRAVELGDGWMPFGLTSDELRIALAGFPARRSDFEVILQSPRLDPLADAEGTLRAIERLGATGATMVNIAFHHRDPEQLLDQMSALRTVVPEAFDTAPDLMKR